VSASYSNKTAVITGASRGLGAGMAHELHRLGFRLGLCARSQPALEGGERVVAERVDVTDGEAVEAFAHQVEERFGHVDLWINNAGILEPIAPLRDVTSAALRRHLDINVLGVFHGTRAYVRMLRRRAAEGVLVNISSGAGRHGYAGWSAYCAGKGAVDLLTESVQIEERDAGLRAYAVAPGIINTDMQAMIRATTPDRFPEVERFRQLERDDAFSSAEYVARELVALAFDPSRRPEEVRVGIPAEPR
jgi:benzil reductase ((S)-benzoin forming)